MASVTRQPGACESQSQLESQESGSEVAGCPYLGPQARPTPVFADPTEEQRCHGSGAPERIELEHQAAFCLTSGHKACPRFVPLPEQADPSSPPLLSRLLSFLRQTPLLHLLLWVVLGVLGGGAVLLYLTSPTPPTAAPAEVPRAAITPSPSPTELPTQPPTETPTTVAVVVATAVPPATLPPPPATPTLAPGRLQAVLVPSEDAVGCVSSAERANRFGDSDLQAGAFEGHVYHGAAQFSLDPIPLGARVEHATLELMGLNVERREWDADAIWALRLLSPEADANWPSATFDQVHNAAVAETISPELTAQDLAARKVNIFTFAPSQCAELERRLERGLVSFRLDGPSQGADNLFAWSAGYRGGYGSRPVLRVIYQPPPTPTPVVIPPTPRPANVLTAAAVAAAATHQATAIGTPTPLPPNVVTATPPIIVVPTSTPRNAETAQWIAAVATAQAFLHGTPTPLPADVWTATPVPTPSSTPTYVVIGVTRTPTPQNILTAAAMVAAGTPTSLPPNWVTPVVVTTTPTPGSAATAQWVAAVATAQAFLHGTPTPLPPNLWTATPVPTSTPTRLLIPLHEITPRPATRTPTPTPSAFPAVLRGKIAFRSDRLGGSDILVMDADGSNVTLLVNTWAYEAARAQRAISPDGQFLAYQDRGRHGLDLFLHDLVRDVHSQLTRVGTGTAMAYDAAWSPDSVHIVFASNQEGDDEIFVVARDAGPVRQLTHNEWEWDKHPDYSPDGERIVFCSNAVTSHRQIWVMNADGSDKRNISNNAYDDWDPVWINGPASAGGQ